MTSHLPPGSLGTPLSGHTQYPRLVPSGAGKPPEGSAAQEQEVRLASLIEQAGHLLPAQGPITVFVHHNPLHALEHLPFDTAVKHAARLFGCHPYLPKERYRQKMARGRIRVEDLSAMIAEILGCAPEDPRVSQCVASIHAQLGRNGHFLSHSFALGAKLSAQLEKAGA